MTQVTDHLNHSTWECKYTRFLAIEKKICIFELVLQLTTSVRCMMLMQGTNEPAAEQCGASWVNELVVATEMETKFKYKTC